ncbi:MAG: ABC transporter substrate-binding protein [Alphaproteobacteria bacterium]
MNRRQFAVSVFLVTGALVGSFPALAAAANEQEAKTFMINMGQRTQEALTKPGLTDEQRISMLGGILDKALDIEGLGKFTLGPFLRQSNADRVAEFLSWFHKYVVMFYPKLMLKLSFVGFEVRDARSTSDQDILIGALLKRREGGEVQADWQLRMINGTYQIVDVKVEGHSLRAFTRAKFERVLREKWIDGLILVLKDWVMSGTEKPVF